MLHGGLWLTPTTAVDEKLMSHSNNNNNKIFCQMARFPFRPYGTPHRNPNGRRTIYSTKMRAVAPVPATVAKYMLLLTVFLVATKYFTRRGRNSYIKYLLFWPLQPHTVSDIYIHSSRRRSFIVNVSVSGRFSLLLRSVDVHMPMKDGSERHGDRGNIHFSY